MSNTSPDRPDDKTFDPIRSIRRACWISFAAVVLVIAVQFLQIFVKYYAARESEAKASLAVFNAKCDELEKQLKVLGEKIDDVERRFIENEAMKSDVPKGAVYEK